MSNDPTEISALAALSLNELRDAWRARFKRTAPAYQSRALLLRAFVYQLEARREGGMSGATRRRLAELADKFAADPRYVHAAPQALQPGTVLVRDWNGKRYGVTVIETGFLFDDVTYASLSKVAEAITGVKRSGPLFFKTAVANEAPAA